VKPRVEQREHEVRATALHTRTLAGLTVALLAVMVVHRHYEPYYANGYLVWNLFLAWIPYICARTLWRIAHGRATPLVLLLPLLVTWLAFLPNAPYLVTDLEHAHHPHTWMILIELAMYSLVLVAGVLLGVAAVQPVHRLVAERYGSFASAAFPPVIAIAVAFGVYLGRVQRWNSWNLLERPGELLHHTWAVIGHPIDHPRAYAGIAAFGVAFLLSYLVLTTERRPLGPPQRQV
jgi:uncharacterized membrane protein